MRFLLLNELEHGLAKSTHGVACIQYVQNNIRRVDDLVEFSVNSSRCSLGVNWLIVVCMGWGFNEGRCKRLYKDVRSSIKGSTDIATHLSRFAR